MTPDLLDLARAVVASPHWRWMPGMAWIAYRTRPLDDVAGRIDRSTPYHGALPDLTDPATLGCLLALVREAWGDPTICLPPSTVDRYGDAEPVVVWSVERLCDGAWLRHSGAWGEMPEGHRDPLILTPSEAAALVAALLAAPEPAPAGSR